MTLIEVLVAVAILGVVVAGAAGMMGNLDKVQTFLFSKKAYQDVDEALRVNIKEKILDHIKANHCNGAKFSFPGNLLQLGVSNVYVSVAGLSPAPSVPVLPADAPATVVAAGNRCRSQTYRGPGGGNNDYYFCLMFMPAPGETQDTLKQKGVKKNSLLRSNQSFAEVNFRFTDLATGGNATCSQFYDQHQGIVAPTQNSFGGVMTMAIYWGVLSSPTMGSKISKFNVLNRIFYVPAS